MSKEPLSNESTGDSAELRNLGIRTPKRSKFLSHSSQIHHLGFSDWIGHSLSLARFHNRAMDRDQTGRSALFATLIAISFRFRSSRPGSAK